MKCNFTVGQRVVCFDDEWDDWALINGTSIIVPGAIRVPMLNEVLTIAEIVPIESDITAPDLVALRFQEIGGGWVHTHFRPLSSRPTDISIFQKMLTPAGRIPVDA